MQRELTEPSSAHTLRCENKVRGERLVESFFFETLQGKLFRKRETI